MSRVEYFMENRYTGASPELRKHIRETIATNEDVLNMLVELMDYLISLSIHIYSNYSDVHMDIRNIESVVEDMYRRHDPFITKDTYLSLKETINMMESNLSLTEVAKGEHLIEYIDQMVMKIYQDVIPDIEETLK